MKNVYLLLFLFVGQQTLSAQVLEVSLIESYEIEEIQQIVDNFGAPPGLLTLRYPVDLYKVRYLSVNPSNNQPVEASGALAVPRGLTCELPLSSYQHGTIAEKDDVPSRNNQEANIGKVFSSTGYVVCMPDYIGLGDSPGLHPYVHARSEADASLDLLRAARELQDSLNFALNAQLFIFGYSQGGHATMALHKLIQEEYPFEFQVTCSVPCSGPYDLSGVQAEVITSDNEYPTPGYLPYVVLAYQSVYGNLYNNLSEVFIPPYDTLLSQLFDGTYSMGYINNQVPSIPNQILVEGQLDDFETNVDNPIRIALEDNDLWDWTPQAPVRIMYCDGDDQVNYQNAVVAYERFVENGAPDVQSFNFGPFNHGDCVLFCLIAGYNAFEAFKITSGSMVLGNFELGDAGLPEPNSGSLTFSAAGGTMPYTYTLSDTLLSEEPSFEGLFPGNYSLNVADAQGCYLDTTISIATQLSFEANDFQELVLFPNPATDQVQLVASEAGTLTVFTAKGQLAAMITVAASGKTIVPVAGFQRGVYFGEFSGRSGRKQNLKFVLN